MTRPVPVTGTVIAKDIAERAFFTFLQAFVGTIAVTPAITDFGSAKRVGLAASIAGASAVLSFAKSLLASYVTGTAGFSKQVAEASSAVTPPPSAEVYHAGPVAAPSAPLSEEAPMEGVADDDDVLDTPDEVADPVEPDGELGPEALDEHAREKLAGNRPTPGAAQ